MINKIKFVFGILIILGTLIWLAVSGFNEGKAYYVTVDELYKMGDTAYQKRVRVAGIVENGSIKREGIHLSFIVTQDTQKLSVQYIGRDPVPDTFKEGIQAVVEGKLSSNGIFQAQKIQAKCGSKYEAEFKLSSQSIVHSQQLKEE